MGDFANLPTHTPQHENGLGEGKMRGSFQEKENGGEIQGKLAGTFCDVA